MVFSGSVSNPRRSFTIGTGTTTQHNGTKYPNPPPFTCVDYRVFIRVYSGIDVSQTVEMTVEYRERRREREGIYIYIYIIYI